MVPGRRAFHTTHTDRRGLKLGSFKVWLRFIVIGLAEIALFPILYAALISESNNSYGGGYAVSLP